MARIGVFVCWCGSNIAQTVDCPKVAEETGKLKDVAYSTDYKYMCSSPGQNLILEAVKKHNLDGIVVASCSPRMHESTFRTVALQAGINPYLLEMANLREHCSWVHENKEEATEKAIDLVRMMVARVAKNKELEKIEVPITKKALVIGGGIAGIQAALDIANGGVDVILVEREPSIGGHMSQLDETFPTLDCSQCILTPRMVEVATHKKIKLYTYSEIENVDGYIGNFEVKIRKKARCVDEVKCTGCASCMEACPVKVDSEFELGLKKRKAIYTPFPQAVPNTPVIDKEHCIDFKDKGKGKCRKCVAACPAGAVVHDQKDEIICEKVGAIVVATGFDLLAKDTYGEYGYGKYKDIISGLEFERLISASGPTGGKVLRPSDSTEPKKVVFIKCIGSRDEKHGISYCSKICCMYTAKHAMLLKHKCHGAQPYVFYMDIRAAGKGYEEFINRAMEEEGVVYLRGRVSKIYQRGGKLMVKGVDTLTGKQVEIDADLVVLATAVKAQPDADSLAQKLGISYDSYNFFSEAHPKLRPVETNTAGIFLAGCCQAPKDIPDSVSQASAAASKVLGLFSNEVLEREPLVASVNENICTGCFACETVCAYRAISHKETSDKREVAYVNPGLCQGCGACVATCRAGCLELEGYTDLQIYEQLKVLV